MPTDYQITLTRADVTTEVRDGRKTYRLSVTVTSPNDTVDPKIIIFQREAVAPDGQTIDWFHSVCCAMELTDLPADTPNEDGFYRADSVDLLFFDIDLLERCWQILKQDVADLAVELYELEQLTPGETVTFHGGASQ